MKYIDVKRNNAAEPVQLHYSDYGHGKPVILIHGWPLSKEMWEYQTEALVSNGMRVIAYDRRGFGKSCRPWDGYDYDTLTDDLKSIIDQLQLKDVTLVGFSMGGGEVARYFGRHGGANVSKVVLISAVTPYFLKTEDNPKGLSKAQLEEIKDKIRHDRIEFLDEFGKTFFGYNLINKSISAPSLEYYRMLASVACPRATIQCANSFATTDFRKDLQAIHVPALVIHGDKDKTVPIEASGEKTAQAIRESIYHIYEGAPHGLFFTHRNQLNDDLVSFITGKKVQRKEVAKSSV